MAFSLFITAPGKSQDISYPESKQDTVFNYYKDGTIKSWSYSDSGIIVFTEVFEKGPYYKMTGEYRPIEGSNDIIKLGTWKLYSRYGDLKDSIIYKNGSEIYKARFNQDGSLQYENMSGLLLITNQIIEKCDGDYVVRFKNREITVKDSMILPTYQKQGFYVVKNGVYDFVINGKKHFQSVVLNIHENGFFISKNWNFEDDFHRVADSIFIDIKASIQIRLVSINNGVGDIPIVTETNDYEIQIIKNDKYCKFIDAKFSSLDGETIGHYYFTFYGLKNLKMKGGKPYLCEKTGDYLLRRN